MDCGTITQEQAEHHPQKNIITRALGVDYRLEPEFTTVALQAGDVLLLCTDGLTNAVPTEQLEQLLRSGSFLRSAGRSDPYRQRKTAARITLPPCWWE